MADCVSRVVSRECVRVRTRHDVSHSLTRVRSSNQRTKTSRPMLRMART
jgi:hypothetical protein